MRDLLGQKKICVCVWPKKKKKKNLMRWLFETFYKSMCGFHVL